MRTRGHLTARCPTCIRGRVPFPSRRDDTAACDACGRVYPASGGVLDLVPELAYSRSRAQAAMEWAPLVSIYESRLWRRSPLFGLMTGIDFERECATIAHAAALTDTDRVLDVACGTGQYTRALARRVARGAVVGLDLSPPMLGYAADSALARRLANVEFLRASALDLPFEDGTFNAVNCCGALHLFPHPARALAESARVLVEGGRVTLAVFRRAESTGGDGMAGFARSLVGVESFSRPQLARLLEEAGFSDFHLHHEGPMWMLASALRL